MARRSALWLAAPLVLAASLLPAQDNGADDDSDSGFLTGLIERNLSDVSRDVQIRGFEGALSTRATIDSITISDRKGAWLVLEGLAVDWDRSRLLRGRIEIQELVAERIAYLRAPVADPSLPSAEAKPFALPNLPVAIQIDTLDARRIEVNESVLGEDVALAVKGDVLLERGSLDTEISAQRLDGPRGQIDLLTRYDSDERQLELGLLVDEAEGGLISKTLDLPGRPALRLDIVGSDPIDNYEAAISLITDGEPRLSGTVALGAEAATDGAPDLPGAQQFAVDLGGDITALLAPDYREFFGPDMQIRAKGQRGSDGAMSLQELEIDAKSLSLSGDAALAADGWPETFSLKGALSPPEGERVLLPLSGPRTYVESALIDIAFDAEKGDGWAGKISVQGLERPGLAIDSLHLDGNGEIARGTGSKMGKWSADLDYGAEGLSLADAGTAQALGPALSGTVSVFGQTDQPTEIRRLTLSGPGLEAEGDAKISGPDDRLHTQLGLDLVAEDLGRFSGMVGQDLAGSGKLRLDIDGRLLDRSFSAEISGDTQDLAIGQEVLDTLIGGAGVLRVKADRDATGTRLEAFRLATEAAEITATANLTSGRSTADFLAEIHDSAALSDDLSGPARVTGTLRQGDDLTIDAEIRAIAPEAEAVITAHRARPENLEAVDMTPVGIEARLNFADLAPYSDLLGRDLAGQADAVLRGSILPDDGSTNLRLDAETQNLALGQDRIDALLAGEGDLSLQIARAGNGTLRLRDLRMDTDTLTARADATLANGTLTADLDARIADASRLDPALTGDMRLTGTARQNNDGASVIDMVMRAPGAVVDIDASVAPPAAGYATSFIARADLDQLSRYAGLTGRPLRGGLDATFTGTAEPRSRAFDVVIEGETQSLGLGQPQLDGILRGTGTLSARASRTPKGDLSLRDLSFDSATSKIAASGQMIDGRIVADLDATIRDSSILAPGLSGRTDITGKAQQRDAGQTDVTLTAKGPGTDVDISATLAPPEEGYAASFTGKASLARLSMLRPLVGQPISGGLSLTTSGTARPRDGAVDARIDAQATNLGIGNPTLDPLLRGVGTIRGQITRSQTGALQVNGLRAEFPNATLSADLQAAPNSSDGRANFDARIRDLAVLTDGISGPLALSGQASAQGGAWGLDVSAQGPGGSTAKLDGTLRPSGSSNLQATGRLPLALANKRLAPRSLDGDASFDLRLNGPIGLNALSGTIRTSGARLAIPRIGKAITEIGGTVQLTGGRAEIALSGQPSDGGEIAISGPVQLSGNFPGRLSVALRDLVIRDPQLFETTGNGSLLIDGPLTGGAAISGNVALAQTDIRVPSSSIGSLGPLPEVQHIGAPTQVVRTLDRAGLTVAGVKIGRVGDGKGGTRIARPFPLDLTISAPSRIFVRGRGLDAELGGQLRLGGTTRNVIPAGRFELVRGRLDILQQRFDLTEGYATLQGDFNPYLYLEAVTETDDTAVSIILDGEISDLEIRFASSPDLPQDEILSRLIFGRDLSSISPLQAVQLASAVNTLAGRGDGGLMTRLRENVGLDDLDVSTSDDGNTQVRAGKYLGENLYTDVAVESDGTSEVNLNLDLTDTVTLRGSASSTGESSVGVFFERDY